MKRLLIISNNVLSETNNNGKTLLSFIKNFKDVEVSQLYFSGEIPRIKGYNYFQLADKDIIKGFIHPNKRGRSLDAIESSSLKDDFSIRKKLGRNDVTLFCRELLWIGRWKSNRLNEWLEYVNPNYILFVAGDSVFAYSICSYIQKKYSCRLTVYVTDDYVMDRRQEHLLHKAHRYNIRKALNKILKKTDCFYTISKPMQIAYKELFGKDSFLAVNMPDDLKHDYRKKETDYIITYAGSFYYNRFRVLRELANAIKHYNDLNVSIKVKLMIYSNSEPSSDIKSQICVPDVSEYGGALDSTQLTERLNTSDALLFVESFDEDQIEKVKYSLSTKIPEYMSVEKPILAIGPKEIGSMQYLEGIAFCISDRNQIMNFFFDFMTNADKQKDLAYKARSLFLKNHRKDVLQLNFYNNIFGCGESQ